MSTKEDHDYFFKFIVIGDCGVGKSSLQTQFIDSRFEPIVSTIGIEFGARSVTLRGPTTGAAVTAKLQVWDTLGQERFHTINRAFFRGATGVLIVFDITQRRTFDNVMTWLRTARENASPELPVSITLVGNMTDLEEKREVTQEEAKDFAKAHALRYIETSAKTRHNVDDAFIGTAMDVLSKIKSGELDPELILARRLVPHGKPGPRADRPSAGRCMC